MQVVLIVTRKHYPISFQRNISAYSPDGGTHPVCMRSTAGSILLSTSGYADYTPTGVIAPSFGVSPLRGQRYMSCFMVGWLLGVYTTLLFAEYDWRI